VLTGALPLAVAVDHGLLRVESDDAGVAATSSLLALPPPFPLVVL
jgi:hypothetical protein